MQRDTSFRRATIWLATIGYALVASGLPLPLGGMQPASPTSAAAKRLAGKDRSQPFPCMDKPCGCATAEQCFSNCCCNTPAELLAWAKANRVEPGLIAALKRRAAAPVSQASCCSTAAKTSCCAEAVESYCCESESPVPEAMPVSAKTVVLRAMLACGGSVAEWLALGAALPQPPVMACDRAAEPIASLILTDESSLSERLAPEGPPPRST
jgi:hypothetical protein